MQVIGVVDDGRRDVHAVAVARAVTGADAVVGIGDVEIEVDH